MYEMAPVLETAMTKSMPIYDLRGKSNWTAPEQVADPALALASRNLDAFIGRYVPAGADTEESLIAGTAVALTRPSAVSCSAEFVGRRRASWRTIGLQ